MVLAASRSETLDSHVLAVVKSNTSATNIARKYKMTHEIPVGNGIVASRTETDTIPIQMNVDEIFAISVKTKDTIEEANAQSTAEKIIVDFLKDGTAKTWKEIVKSGKAEGVSEATLRRTRDQLKAAGNMQSTKIGKYHMWTYTQNSDFTNFSNTDNKINNYENYFKR